MAIEWIHDRYLSKISERLGQIDVVSFDIFDTLLLRALNAPDDVFLEVGRRMENFAAGSHFPPEAFTGMRKEADSRARKHAWESKGLEEITLEEIYAEFHLDSAYVEAARCSEFDIERERVYLNQNVADFIRFCADQGKRLALVSDTYFSKEQIIALLASAGFDVSIPEAIIISSEHRALKGTGNLFQVLKNAFPDVTEERFLHIGDNQRADLDGAGRANINAEYYGAMHENVFSPMAVERNFFHCDLGEIASLRKLALSSVPAEFRDSEQRVFFETGSAVFGAVYALYAEWILEKAEQEGIHTIITFMREGALLSELIGRAAKNRGMEMNVAPIFISRRTTELTRHERITGDIIADYLHRPLLTVGELFSIFYLDIKQTSFDSMGSMTIGETKENGSFEGLNSYFCADLTLETINHKVTEQRELLLRYIQKITNGQAAITVDIGFRGTMQDCLSRMKANGEARLLHLVLMGIPYNNRFLLDGTPLCGWLGYGGENLDLIDKIYRRIQLPEAITNADVGTTIGYREAGDDILAVLEEVSIDEVNKLRKAAIWAGIFQFQQYWFDLQAKKTGLLDNVLKKKSDFLGILLRFLTMPASEEAKLLGQLYYDESILNSVKATICKPNDFLAFDRSGGADEFIELCERGSGGEPIYWPEGIVAIQEPSYFYKKYLKMIPEQHYKKLSHFLLNGRLAGKRAAIYGAGKVGRELLEASRSMGYEFSCFVDADPKVQNLKILGLNVLSPGQSVDKVDVYLITPLRFEKEIRETLEGLYQGHNNQPDILLYD